jgi:hypothetical protein
MAIKKDSLKALLKQLKVSDEAIKEIIEGEAEVDIKLPDTTMVLDKTEMDARDKNKKDEGIKVGRDLQIKEIKEKAGLDYTGEGSLDPDKLIKEISTKAEGVAKEPVDKKVTALQEQVALLQKQVTDKDVEVQAAKAEKSKFEFVTSLLTELPQKRSSLISDKEYITLIEANLEFTAEGVKRNGELLRDSKTQNPIGRKEAIESFFNERKWIAEETTKDVNGRGGGNSSGGGVSKPSNINEAEVQFLKDNPNLGTGTAEFQTYVTALKKENPAFSLSTAQAVTQ